VSLFINKNLEAAKKNHRDSNKVVAIILGSYYKKKRERKIK